MLKQQTIAIVKSTAPILAEHGETLTRHFYIRMFNRNPEVAAFFNAGNQAAGLQQKALAAAICAYAANIDNLKVLESAVERIAQKHASLRIQPEHYPVVGANLIGAIQEVLGTGATPEVVAAWSEAYAFLAEILMGREREIYTAQSVGTDGWQGFKPFHLIRKVRESAVITSFYLAPAEGGGVPAFRAGQFLTVRIPHPDTGFTMRNYSISNSPGEGCFRISVKREPGGYVSNFLHDQLEESGEIEVGPPCGEFFFDPAEASHRPLVLISAGVGITPTLSILKTALSHQARRAIVFVHGALNGRVHAFRDDVRDKASAHGNLKVHYRYSEAEDEDSRMAAHDSEGFIDEALLEALVPGRDAEYYFCGPKPFMAGVYRILRQWSIPETQIHFEFFGPRQELEEVAA